MRTTSIFTGRSQTSFHTREWAILTLFLILTLLMLYPLSIFVASMVPEPTDPLLNVWRMQWNVHALLGGPAEAANIFNTNIFYPFPLTLAYSEHFLMIAMQALPFLLVADSHLVGLNVSVLLTFVLSGYAIYLLMTDWTGSRWAGMVAGVLFAFSPHRFGQLNHLELLITQWLPLTLLALHWTLTRAGWRYPALFMLFFNLQALSGFHFGLNLTIACLLLAVVYLVAGRIYWRRGLWGAGILSILVTLLLNWPIWRVYLQFSDIMGAIRTPGEVRIYSAALTDYFTAIPYNFLYGWTFGYWLSADHQFQPLMPFGMVGLLLVVVGLSYWLYSLESKRQAHYHPVSRLQTPTTIFALLLVFVSFLLSFGLNENALGKGLAPLLKQSPYFWLYDNVAIFQGIRVPGRFGVLVLLGLTILAGWGAAAIIQLVSHQTKISGPKARASQPVLSVSLIALILLEAWSAPLVGPEFPAGQDIPPVYDWLRRDTPAETVVLELPFQGPSEFSYEYYSSYHWRRLANGGTGFTPPIYKELRRWFNEFPSPRSVDIIQQLGLDLVILHADRYQPEDWQRVLTDLPRYLPAIEQIRQIDDALILQMAKPLCQAEPDQINVTFTPTTLDGLPDSVAVTYHNPGFAAFVADVQQVSHLNFVDQIDKNFTEPLVTPAGEMQAVIVPLQEGQLADLSGAWLATLDRNVAVDREQGLPKGEIVDEPLWQSLGLKYADGAHLMAYGLTPETPAACQALTVSLSWEGGQLGDTAVVQLLDPFGRVAVEDAAQPWHDGVSSAQPDVRKLPLVGSMPAGRYGLRVLVRAEDGTERSPVTDEGVLIPTNQIPPLPVVIHPPARLPETAAEDVQPKAVFDNGIILLGAELNQERAVAGDWLRFSLVWQVAQPLDTELTVFTQLLGPDGQVWGQHDNQPGGGWYGVPLWRPNQPVVDDYAFQLDPNTPPGTYRLIAGLYHTDTLARSLTQTGADFVEIATVTVANSARTETE